MGHCSHSLHIISIIIFLLISFYCIHIFISKSSFNPEKYFNTVHKNLIFEKFRFLLEIERFSTRKSNYAYLSPSPSPSPLPGIHIGVPAPAPAPVLHFHRHAYPPPGHQHHSLPTTHKIQKKDEKAKRVLIAVLVSFGVLISILCAIGLFICCKKHKRRHKGISKFISSQSSVIKVSSAPGPDLFYLNSIEAALEPELCCMKLNYETYVNKNTSNNALDVREELDKKLVISESSSGRCFSVEEITTVHENEISNFERITQEEVHKFDDKIITEEAHSSDDESFHSFCNSHSSQLSVASVVSLSEISEAIPENLTNEVQPQSTPPPPPPPPPPNVHIKPSLSTPSSKISMKSSLKSSFTLPSTSSSPKTAAVGVPPPPCLAPLTKGHIYPPKIPSPPSHLTQQMPLGKNGSPLPKLKPLHWDKVRAAPERSTVWDKLRSSSFEFDEEMIESLFGYNMQNPMKNDEVKSKTPSPSKHVLEPKRLQNITILSKALNVTAEQVCGALIRGDGLSLQDLEALSKMVLTKEEEAKLSNYRGDILELGSSEKLVKLMLKIPFAFARIEAMFYRETFDDEVRHLRKSFSMLEEACKELRSSRFFLKLLEAVLKTGNRMNVGTIRGEAKAFKLDALLKLADVKGTDGKTTLLHFVVQEIARSEGIRVSESIMGKINQKSKTTNNEDKEENYRKMGLELVTGLSKELCNVKKTATIDPDVLASSVVNLSGGVIKLQHLIQKDMKMEENKGNFVNAMRLFLKYAEMKLKELREDENRVLLHVKEITEYFHGNVSKDESNPLQIFVIVRDFLGMLDHVCKELKSSKGQRSSNPLAPFP